MAVEKRPDNLKDSLITFLKKCKNIPWPAFQFVISSAAEAWNATLHDVTAAVSPMKKGSKAE